MNRMTFFGIFFLFFSCIASELSHSSDSKFISRQEWLKLYGEPEDTLKNQSDERIMALAEAHVPTHCSGRKGQTFSRERTKERINNSRSAQPLPKEIQRKQQIEQRAAEKGRRKSEQKKSEHSRYRTRRRDLKHQVLVSNEDDQEEPMLLQKTREKIDSQAALCTALYACSSDEEENAVSENDESQSYEEYFDWKKSGRLIEYMSSDEDEQQEEFDDNEWPVCEWQVYEEDFDWEKTGKAIEFMSHSGKLWFRLIGE